MTRPQVPWWRTAPALAGAGLLALTLVLGALLVPWSAAGGPVTPAPLSDFPAGQRELADRFAAARTPWSDVSLLLAIAVPCVLGFTPLGARVIARLQQSRGRGPLRRITLRRVTLRHRPVAVAVAVLVLTLIGRLVTLPSAWAGEQVRRDYGLSTRGTGRWIADVATSWAVSAVVTAVVLVLLGAVARRWPRRWWLAAAPLMAGCVVAGSYAYPLVVEPLFSSFASLPAGPLRTELLTIAEREGVEVDDVLVSDASRRTTAANAYVSGLGDSRRVVVYDTLLDQATDAEVAMVVAHEIGHVAHRDVARGTALGAVGAAGGVCLLAAVTGSTRLRRRSGVVARERIEEGRPVADPLVADPLVADPRGVALVLALVVVATQLSSPVVNLVSRQIETAADVAALDATEDPATFVDLQLRLSATNLTDVDPPRWRTVVFATHPPTRDRIGLARSWPRTGDDGGSS